MRLMVGQAAPQFTVADLYRRRVSLHNYAGAYLLLSFHRFAVCPLCDLRLWHLTRRYEEYRQRGLYMMTFVESVPDKTHWYLNRLECPFPIVPDLRGAIYRLYGVETSAFGIARGLLTRQGAYRQAAAQHLGGWKLKDMDGTFTRLPASFVIGPDQRIALAYYGHDSGDFLPFTDLDVFLSGVSARQSPSSAWHMVPSDAGR
jgi:peroxiredoxin